MRTAPLATAVLGAMLLAGCGGGGRPDASDVVSRLNAAGVDCKAGPGFAVANGVDADSSCTTPEGRRIAVLQFDGDDAQQQFLDQADTLLAGKPYAGLVYDFGYVLAVPDPALAERVTTRMDAQRLGLRTAATSGGSTSPTRLGTAPAS